MALIIFAYGIQFVAPLYVSTDAAGTYITLTQLGRKLLETDGGAVARHVTL